MKIYLLKDMLENGDANKVDISKIPQELAEASRKNKDTIPFQFVEGFQDHIVILDEEGNFVDLDQVNLDDILKDFLDVSPN